MNANAVMAELTQPELSKKLSLYLCFAHFYLFIYYHDWASK